MSLHACEYCGKRHRQGSKIGERHNELIAKDPAKAGYDSAVKVSTTSAVANAIVGIVEGQLDDVPDHTDGTDGDPHGQLDRRRDFAPMAGEAPAGLGVTSYIGPDHGVAKMYQDKPKEPVAAIAAGDGSAVSDGREKHPNYRLAVWEITIAEGLSYKRVRDIPFTPTELLLWAAQIARARGHKWHWWDERKRRKELASLDRGRVVE